MAQTENSIQQPGLHVSSQVDLPDGHYRDNAQGGLTHLVEGDSLAEPNGQAPQS